MANCCENKTSDILALREKQARVLYSVLAINGVMFFVEFSAGWLAGSTALLADSLDMFGDATVYALTLYVLHRSTRLRNNAAIFKGVMMLLLGMLVIVEAVRKLIEGDLPDLGIMSTIGVAALIANAICFAMLYRRRSDDLNMSSTWLCSRNDLIANVSVIAAAGLVAITGSVWPDVLVGLCVAGLFIHSAIRVLSEAFVERGELVAK